MKKSTRTIFINDSLRNKQFGYLNNYIRTTKYTKYNFLFLCLLVQFKRLANVYFLLIAINQSIEVVSPLNPATAIMPLCFVLLMSMIREGIEDYVKYKSD